MLDRNEPLISVIVPVYNGENYLQEALISIQNQTYKNFECIVVDDGSKNSKYVQNIVNHLNDNRFKAFRKMNGGVASALNLGISKSLGSHIAWLSHDDLWAPTKLEIQMNYSDERTILFSNYSLIDVNNTLITTTSFETLYDVDNGIVLLSRGLLHGCSSLIPKTLLEEIGLFDESLLYTQDYDLWLRALMGGKQLKLVREPLITGRVHPNQTGVKENTRAETNELWRKIVDFWISTEMSKKNLSLGRKITFYQEFESWAFENKLINASEYLALKKLDLIKDVKVSVVIPHRDRVNQIFHAIFSCLNQTHENIEIIVIDDSHDSYNLATLLKKKLNSTSHDKLRIVHNSKHGVSSARNLGINLSSGEYIAFLDSDDVLMPDKISLQLLEMIKTDSNFSHTNYFVSHSGVAGSKVVDSSHNSGPNLLESMVDNCAIATPTVMILNQNSLDQLFDESLSIGEDSDAWMTYLLKYGNRSIHVPQPLTIVRTNMFSASLNQNNPVIVIRQNSIKYNMNNTRTKVLLLQFRQILVRFAFFFWRLIGRPSFIRNNSKLKKLFWKIRGF